MIIYLNIIFMFIKMVSFWGRGAALTRINIGRAYQKQQRLFTKRGLGEMLQRILGTLKDEKAFYMESIGPQRYGQHSRLREEAWTNAKRSKVQKKIQNRIKSIEYTGKTAWGQSWITERLIFAQGVTARQCCNSTVSNSVFKCTADMQ